MSDKRFRVYVCAGLHCTPAGRDALLRRLEQELWDHRLDSDVEIRPSSCLNRCAFAPNMTVWPGPVRYVALTPDDIARIVVEHLRDGAVVESLLYQEPAY